MSRVARPGTDGPEGGGFLGSGLRRSADRRLVAGVAGGLAEQLRVDPLLLRLAFALLSVCGGAGVLAYVVLWVALPARSSSSAPIPVDARRDAGVALVVAGTIVVLRGAGLWLGDAAAWAVGLGALGVCVIWMRSDENQRVRLSRLAQRAPEQALDAIVHGPWGKLRLTAGGLLLATGVAILLVRSRVLGTSPGIVVAVVVTVTGLGVFFGPLAWRLLGQLAHERGERIRSQERAAVAAHLHDSVLQTLALIQRAEGQREMVALARNQERELRAWLNGRRPASDETLAGAVDKVAASVELSFKVPVEVVTVGDLPLDDRLQAVVDACREAAVNAAKHSGAAQVAIYVEVEPGAVTAYVRDQGSGFDPGSVAPDRRGLSESIRGRMQRAGGSATIVTEAGAGTEVQLSLPLVNGRAS